MFRVIRAITLFGETKRKRSNADPSLVRGNERALDPNAHYSLDGALKSAPSDDKPQLLTVNACHVSDGCSASHDEATGRLENPVRLTSPERNRNTPTFPKLNARETVSCDAVSSSVPLCRVLVRLARSQSRAFRSQSAPDRST